MASPLDYINKKEAGTFSAVDVINQHRRAGTLGKSAVFHRSTTSPTSTSQASAAPVKPADMGFWERTSDNVRALTAGEVSFTDVAKQVPKTALRQSLAVANYVAPALTKFFDTTGSIFGEGLAYAVDKNVREQYRAGNLDILPTITEMTTPKLAKYTFAAGLETAIFRSLPGVAKMKLGTMGAVGALEGVGFAISEGLAKDETPEEIIKKMPLYGVSGAALSVLMPFMLPLLRSEVKYLPQEIKKMFGKVEEASAPKPPPAKQLDVISRFPTTTAVPVSTPNTRYHAYLRSQGYEPYVPEGKLPVIDAGETPKPKSDLPTIQIGEPDVTVNLPPPPGTKLVPEKSPVATKPPAATKPLPTAEKPAAAPTAPTKPKETFQGEEFTTEDIIVPAPRVTKVPGQQLPVGDGKTKTSSLEARMRKTLDEVNESSLSEDAAVTYQQMNRKGQLAKDAAVVEADMDGAMAILRGEKNIPEGSTYNGIALALAKQAEAAGDAATAVRLASLRSTRAGQEISLLAEAEPDSVIGAITDIIKARSTRAGRQSKKGGLNPDAKESKSLVSKAVNETIKEGKKELSLARLKIQEAEKVLNDILC